MKDTHVFTLLKQHLFGLKDPVAMTDLEEKNTDFCEYLSLYGFDAISKFKHQCEIRSIKSGDYDLSCFYWRQSDAKVDVLVVHGLFDHVGLYVPVIQLLLEQGVNVVAFDLPEHGLSSGSFGELKSFDPYADAIRDVLSAFSLSEKRPLVALAQSTGAAAVMCYLLQCQQAARAHFFTKLIFAAPLLRIRAWKRVNLTYALLHRFIQFVPRDFTINSHDEAFCTFLKYTDPLQPKNIPVSWVGAMINWANRFTQLKPLALPGSLIQGTGDRTVDTEFNLAQFRKTCPNLTVSEIDGAYHHLIRESDRYRAQFDRVIIRELTTGFEEKG